MFLQELLSRFLTDVLTSTRQRSHDSPNVDDDLTFCFKVRVPSVVWFKHCSLTLLPSSYGWAIWPKNWISRFKILIVFFLLKRKTTNDKEIISSYGTQRLNDPLMWLLLVGVCGLLPSSSSRTEQVSHSDTCVRRYRTKPLMRRCLVRKESWLAACYCFILCGKPMWGGGASCELREPMRSGGG